MTPENSFFYYSAYIATAVVFVGYAASIWWRRRTLDKKHRSDR